MGREYLGTGLGTNKKAIKKKNFSIVYYYKWRRMELSYPKIKRKAIEFTNNYLNRYKNPTSFNTIRRHLNALLNYLKENDFRVEISSLRPRKQTETLHKPIEDIGGLLEEIRAFNHNLFLCCSLTYGCLLPPHREIRLLKWEDFSDDLKYISIGGDRVKSKRNRIVPVPEFIRKELVADKK